MSNINENERNNFQALIREDGQEREDDKLNIIDVFLGTEQHITLEEMNRLLEEKGYDYESDFVKQLMDRMVDMGFAQKTQFEEQPVRYEHRHLGKHHDHLICTKCGKIVEFADGGMERLQSKIAAHHGFQMLQHRMEIYGLCRECFAARRPLMPLSMAKVGEIVAVKGVAAGGSAQGRLASMGLRLGDRLEIINNTGHGRVILGRDCTRFAIGRGIADKIMVAVAEDMKEPVCETDE